MSSSLMSGGDNPRSINIIMRKIYLSLLFLALAGFRIAAAAEPLFAVEITAISKQQKNAPSTIVSVSGLVYGTDVTLPVTTSAGKLFILRLGSIDHGQSKAVEVSLDDPSIVLPGGANSPGALLNLFFAVFPYRPGELMTILDSSDLLIQMKISDVSEK